MVDCAGVFEPSQKAALQKLCDDLMTDTAAPIFIVTLESLNGRAPEWATHLATLENYAHALFNQWGIGHALLEGKDWNTGVLLLWVKDTGRVRVELGAGWGWRKDDEVQHILDKELVPRRAAGDPSAG